MKITLAEKQCKSLPLLLQWIFDQLQVAIIFLPPQ